LLKKFSPDHTTLKKLPHKNIHTRFSFA